MALPWVTWAAVTPQEASHLGKDLTPVGAEQRGNGLDIPAWTGGLAKDNSHTAGSFYADPFANDKLVMRIDATNMQKHSKRLSEGQKALLKKFPDYHLNVYPSRRSASYPQYVYDAVKDNATRTELLEYGSGVKHTAMSSPFPIPKSGLEVLWNHTLRFRGHSLGFSAVATSVTSTGQRMDTLREYLYYVPYSEVGKKPEQINNKIFFLKRKTLAPANLSGAITLVHETLDQINAPRSAWVYVPGQRRLRRIPDLAYDTPDPNTNNVRSIDQVDMYNGAPDYYDWTLIGKQELYIPYNAYKVHQNTLKLDDILLAKHINPENLRYEPHRIWVVEAKLRLGYDHRYHTRRYYFDEDSWSIVYAEEYDAKGNLLQLTEAHTINYYDAQLVFPTLEVTYDFSSNRYYAEGLANERNGSLNFDIKQDPKDFTPAAVRRQAVR